MKEKFFTIQRISLLSISLLFGIKSWTQTASVQDCIGAIPVCKKIYEQENTFRGEGNVKDFDAGLICMDDEQNSVWYTFQVNQTGQFGFLITPNDLRDDYDWALFDVTNATCEDIRNDPARYLVSCNAAGGGSCEGLTGATGDSNHSIQGANCDAIFPSRTEGQSALNALIDVVRGNTYVLVINNWVDIFGARSGYTIDFGHSTDIGIFDEEPPFVESVDLEMECSGEEIQIQFSERIQCASLSAANFILDGPAGNIPVTLFSEDCDAGAAYSERFTLRAESPIQPEGSYSITVDLNGSTDALDLCDNPAIPNEYTVPNPVEAPVLDLGRDISLCTGQTATIDASSLTGSNYVWSTGASGSPTITVSESGTYSVTVTTDCGEITDEVQVGVSDGPPVIELGEDQLLCPNDTFLLDVTTVGATYLWHDGANEPTHIVDRTGTYAVTVTTKCGSATDRITYNFGQADLVVELGEDQIVCESDEGVSLDATVTLDQANYLWNDGFTEANRSVTESGLYSVTVSTDCGSTTDEIEISFIDGDAQLVDLGEDVVLCPEEEIILDATVSNAAYQWNDGQVTPTISVNQSDLYVVTVTTDCVTDIDSILITVLDQSSINLVPDTSFCEGSSITLDVGPAAENASFEWQDGTTGSSINVATPGIYSVTLSNDCGEVSKSVTVSFQDSLSVELPPDTIICSGNPVNLEALGNATYFIWSDGSSKSSFQVDAPGSYELIAGNECEEAVLTVDVTECITCDFYVPNAISPNGDGSNDILMPYSNFECGIQEYQLQVFDRWGAIIHETTSLSEGWQGFSLGKEVPEGVYLYKMNLNVEENGVLRAVNLSGDVLLVR